jgi:glycosyltransferase involved in cell wall biosynthesis
MAVKLLVGIITFNEIRNIGCCLEFVHGVANEVVVVDSFSRDPTREVREIGQAIPGH